MLFEHVRRTARLTAVALLPALTVSACYTTVPVRSVPRANAELVLTMTPEASAELGGFLGRGTVSARGRLLAWREDSIVVSMLGTSDARGLEQLWRRERVAIPRAAVAHVTERRVSRGRSAALAVVGAVVLLSAFKLGTQGGDGPGGGTPTPAPR